MVRQPVSLAGRITAARSLGRINALFGDLRRRAGQKLLSGKSESNSRPPGKIAPVKRRSRHLEQQGTDALLWLCAGMCGTPRQSIVAP
jgi:hypothetical protein